MVPVIETYLQSRTDRTYQISCVDLYRSKLTEYLEEKTTRCSISFFGEDIGKDF